MSLLQELHLMRPEWLWALIPAIGLGILLWIARDRSGSWRSVIDAELLPYLINDSQSRGSGRWLLPALLICWCLAVFAAAGPSWRQLPQPIHQKQDAMVLMLDLSYSMKAADLAPSRIDRARQKLLDLLSERREGVTGLVAYAGDAHIVTPLTDDNPTIANLLPALNPDMMPVPGSDADAAVSLAVSLLDSAGIRGGQLLLVTDGVSERAVKAIQSRLDGSTARLSVLGVGTASGAPIPLPGGGFLKDREGAIVISGLDEGPLRELSTLPGSQYQRMQIGDGDIQQVLTQSALTNSSETLELERSADTWEDQGYWFVLLLLPLALGLFRRGTLASVALAGVLLMDSPGAQAQVWDSLWFTPDQQGQRALDAGDAARASELFENSDWAGTAAYRSGDFETAAELFDSNQSSDGWYNRGNALARAGDLPAAAEAYRESLALTPEREDASENLALVEELMRQEEQQQEQQNNQDQQDPNQDQEGEQQQQDAQSNDSNQPSDDNQGEQSDGQESSQQNPPQEQEPASQTDEQEDGENSEQEQSSQEQEGQQTPQPDIDMSALDEDIERDQALEQWLRRVPDDPSGLLREKFRYESRQRQQRGETKNDDTYW